MNHLFVRIIVCLTSIYLILAIPTTSPNTFYGIIESNVSKISKPNITYVKKIPVLESDENKIEFKRVNETEFNASEMRQNTTQFSSIDFDIKNKIENKSSVDQTVDQLTELSVDKFNISLNETKIKENIIISDGIQNTIKPLIKTSPKNIYQNFLNKSKIEENLKIDPNLSIVTPFSSIVSSENITNMAISGTGRTTPKNPRLIISSPTPTSKESHRNKRSFRNTLHSTLDELLQMKRKRRASIRLKRNTNYEDILASLLAAEESKYNDNYKYDSYPDKNELNSFALNYILNALNSKESDKNINSDKLSQYYFENLLPLIDTIDTNTITEDENESQEIPIIVEPYRQSVIPVVPYSVSNRYQRIRRSYYDRYRYPLSVYTSLKRKGNNNKGDKGEWGRIVAKNSDRSTLDEDSQEANKIYSLATLLATSNTPDEYRMRYKRSIKQPFKHIIHLKNM